MRVWISGAVEGIVDEAVLRRLCRDAGLGVKLIKVCGGKAKLDQRLRGYNAAARYGRWVVLRDLNSDAECGPQLVQSLLPDQSLHMHLRIVRHSVEAWLLADKQRFSEFFSVSASRIPKDPELIERPKDQLIQIVRNSRRRAIREDMLPRQGSIAKEGPAYSSRLAEYVEVAWRPETAAEVSDTLRRCLARLAK